MIALKNCTIIDGKGGKPFEKGIIIIKDHKISKIGKQGKFKIPASAVVIDAAGKTVMPGLIDAHVHIMDEEFNVERKINTPLSLRFYEAITNLKNTLEAGFTTIRDCGGADLGLKLALESGIISGPRLKICIEMISQTGGHGDDYQPSGQHTGTYYPGMPRLICDGPHEARKITRTALRAGADFIKIATSGGILSAVTDPRSPQFSHGELVAIVEEAHSTFKTVASHVHSRDGIMRALKAGVESIEHGTYVDDECIELMLKQGSFLVPTLLASVAILEDAAEGGRMPKFAEKKARAGIESQQQNIGKAAKAGVKIALGTDASIGPHGSNGRELKLLTRIGLTPMEAILAGTRTAAECLGMEDQIGTLEVGKLADLIMVDGNPLSDIAVLEDKSKINLVMQNGEIKVDNR
jgi:imidazolonepropionase-like amidohydrolase